MRSTVYQPGHIQDEAPAEHGGHEPGVHKALAPEVHGCHSGQDEASQRHQDKVVPEKKKQKSLVNCKRA